MYFIMKFETKFLLKKYCSFTNEKMFQFDCGFIEFLQDINFFIELFIDYQWLIYRGHRGARPFFDFFQIG